MTLSSLDGACDIIMGQAPAGDTYNDTGEGLPLIAGASDFGSRYPDTSRFTTVAAKRCVPGDIILCVRATIGDLNWADKEYCLGRGVAALRPKPGVADGRYLWRAIEAAAPALVARGRGATFKQVTRADIAALNIRLPPLPEQNRIASILDQADDLRRRAARRGREFRRLEISVVQAAMKAPGSQSVDLKDAFWFQEGPGVRNWQFTSAGVKLLNVSNVTVDGVLDTGRSRNHVSSAEAFGKYAHFLVDAGDLIMPSSGIPIDDDGLLRTRSAFADEGHLPLCMNTSTIRFKTGRSHGFLHFLRGWLQTYEFRSQITRLVTGTAQKNFGPSHLKQLRITLPTEAVVAKMVQDAEAVHQLQYKAEAEESRMHALFTSLQCRALQGQI